MGDIELTFDEVFADSPKCSQQGLRSRSLELKIPLNDSISPIYPKTPHPTTTVTPVLTPAVIKTPWNYKTSLEEAFPDAQFIYTECDDEAMTLEDWLRLHDFKSPSEDYRLAVLIRDLVSWKDEQKDVEQYLMSGALPNDWDKEPTMPKAEAKSDATKDESRDEGKKEGKGMGKDREATKDHKENVSFLSDEDDPYNDSEDDT